MPPKNPKPLTPKLRGEVWELQDGRTVTFLQFVEKTVSGRLLKVLTEKGFADTVYEKNFMRRIMPPQTLGE